jgi:nucleoid-associated protein YgaU
MVGRTVRIALGTIGLSLAILCSGCAWRDRPSIADSVGLPASTNAIAPAAAIEVAPSSAPPVRAGASLAISNEPQDFHCLDGSRLRVRYVGSRDLVTVSLNGATPISMRRADEAGLTTYRATNLVLRRSGVRVALASDRASVTVRSGDTLGFIALRIYGDRTRATDIARLNNVENPDLIFPGQILSLPRMERRCRRALYQEASYSVGAAAESE